MGGLFESAGFTCDTKYMCSATKTWSFNKPDAPPTAAVTDVDAALAAAAAGAAPVNGSGAELN